MTVDTANRIWWAADDLWRKETVLTSFEIVKPAPGTNASSVELPKSGAVIEPAFRMAVGIMAHQNPKISMTQLPNYEVIWERAVSNKQSSRSWNVKLAPESGTMWPVWELRLLRQRDHSD